MVAHPDDARVGRRRSDPNSASSARVYDYWLGGDYHYQADRDAADRATRHMPGAQYLARQNRRWVGRVVQYLVTQCGIRQFLDIGSGIPTAGNVHEVAQKMDPSTRVVYVDYERVAVDIGLEILQDNPNTTSLHADMREPDTILTDAATTELLDFTQPVAVIWGSVLHFVEDRDDPVGLVGTYKEHLAPGSYIALSHLTWQFVSDDLRETMGNEGLNAYNERVAEKITSRDLDSIVRFFDNTELVDPGLVALPDWRPDVADEDSEQHAGRNAVVCGVGRLM